MCKGLEVFEELRRGSMAIWELRVQFSERLGLIKGFRALFNGVSGSSFGRVELLFQYVLTDISIYPIMNGHVMSYFEGFGATGGVLSWRD